MIWSRLSPKDFGRYNQKNNTIEISASLCQENEPYKAFKTLLHESRHAYTCHALKHPDHHENKEQLKEWQEGRDNYPSSMEKIDSDTTAYKKNSLEQFSESQGKFFARILQREHEQQRSQEQLKKELAETRALDSPNQYNREKDYRTKGREKDSPIRTFTFGKSFTGEVWENHLRHGQCKLTLYAEKTQKSFNVTIPKGYKAQDLELTEQEAQQLFQRGKTELGRLRFQRPTHCIKKERSQSQNQQKDRSRSRER